MSHETLDCEMSNQTNLKQISHKIVNLEISNQANSNQISHKTFYREIFNQTMENRHDKNWNKLDAQSVRTRLCRGDLDVDIPGVPFDRPDEVAVCDPGLSFILSKDNSVFDNLNEK